VSGISHREDYPVVFVALTKAMHAPPWPAQTILDGLEGLPHQAGPEQWRNTPLVGYVDPYFDAHSEAMIVRAIEPDRPASLPLSALCSLLSALSSLLSPLSSLLSPLSSLLSGR
jgi:hypothetical protein